MPKLVTLKPHRFAGRRRNEGDEYEASGQAMRLSMALGWAAAAPEKIAIIPVKTAADVLRRTTVREDAPVPAAAQPTAMVEDSATPSAIVPKDEPTEVKPVEEIKPKRTYTRRDLTAEK